MVGGLLKRVPVPTSVPLGLERTKSNFHWFGELRVHRVCACRLLPPLENPPTCTLALASIDIRRQPESSSAALLKGFIRLNIASVSGTFFSGFVFCTFFSVKPNLLSDVDGVRLECKFLHLKPYWLINRFRICLAVRGV